VDAIAAGKGIFPAKALLFERGALTGSWERRTRDLISKMRGAGFISVAEAKGNLGVNLLCSGRAARTSDIREKRVELIGGFVLDPMPRSRNNLEPSIRLDIAQCAGAIIEMGVGSRVALAPNPVDARLDER